MQTILNVGAFINVSDFGLIIIAIRKSLLLCMSCGATSQCFVFWLFAGRLKFINFWLLARKLAFKLHFCHSTVAFERTWYNQNWIPYRFESVINISKMNKGIITKPFQWMPKASNSNASQIQITLLVDWTTACPLPVVLCLPTWTCHQDGRVQLAATKVMWNWQSTLFLREAKQEDTFLANRQQWIDEKGVYLG
jgi:hypothetical protein